MVKKAAKSELVAFKVESELAELLNQMPNKSAFIRKAIVSQLGDACPFCNGTGVLPRGHDHQALVIKALNLRSCEGCGESLKLQPEAETLSAGDRSRLEQFFFGGPLYCDGCYVKAPECNQCGWHIEKGSVTDHQRRAHHRGKASRGA